MKKILLAATVSALSTAAFANSAGNHVFHGGLLYLSPNNDRNTIFADTLGGPVNTGMGATVDSALTLGFGYDYFVTDNFSVGLQLGLPPKHDVVSAETGRVAGNVKQISPEVKVKYLFGQSESKWRPYLSAGIAYVKMDGEITDPYFQGVLGKEVDIESKIAPVISAGVQYNVNERLSIAGSISYMHLEPKVEFPKAAATADPAVKTLYTDAVINPVVGYISVGYSF